MFQKGMTYLSSTKGTLENLVLLRLRDAKGDEGRELSPEEVSGGRVEDTPEGFEADAKEKREETFRYFTRCGTYKFIFDE